MARAEPVRPLLVSTSENDKGQDFVLALWISLVPEEGVDRMSLRRSRHLLRSKLLANATQLSSGGIGQIPGGAAPGFRAPKVALLLATRSAPEAGSTPMGRLREKTGAGGGGRPHEP